MKTGRDMDTIFTADNEKISIMEEQINTRINTITKFRECRKNKKLTQIDLSKRTGIPQPNITRFESGKYNPSLEMLVRMAAAMDMKVEVKLVKK